MADYDLLVIGGGPGGYTAALRGAERGARTAVVEAEQPGGACVNFACIPTNILLGSATSYLEAQEQSVMGVFQAGEQFNLGRAVARKDQLVQRLTGGIATMLRTRGVELINGRGRFVDANTVEVALREGGSSRLTAEAFVIATGSRWEPEAIPGYPAERLLTADDVQSLTTPPSSALILADGPGEVPFGAEYAVLLAAAGSEVTLATAEASVFGGLDADLRPMADAGLESLGVRLLTGATVQGGSATTVTLRTPGGDIEVQAEAAVVADPRKPFVDGLGLDAAGVHAPGHVPVDRACRTNVAHIFAVGDLTGGSMLTAAANHMGDVAGANATGGEAVTRMQAIPRLVHTLPEAGWLGIDEATARRQGHDVVTGAADLSFNARALALGAREGAVKVVAERELGEILGVHVVGPGASELLAAAATAMQAEVPVTDLAGAVHWHPSMAESLAEAARRAV